MTMGRNALEFLKEININSIEYKLFINFNEQGNPVLQNGVISSKTILNAFRKAILTAAETEQSITPAAIGELRINSTQEVHYVLQLVFDLSENKYMNLFYFKEMLFSTNKEFSQLIEKIR